MKTLKYFLIVLMSGGLLLSSCEKNQTGPDDSVLALAEDDVSMDLAMDDIFSEVDGVINDLDQNNYEMQSKKSSSAVSATCATITVEQEDSGSFFPRIVTIDYGEGCTVGNRTRKGKIIITVSGPMWLEGSQRIVTLEDYHVNDFMVEGTRTVTHEGRHQGGEYDGKLYFSVILENGKVTTPEGREVTREVEHTRTFVQGEETIWDRRDDIWYIEGSASGINRNGEDYARQITSPLWKEIGCRFITRGTVSIVRGDKPEIILDYGEGTCDPFVNITVDGETKTINLRRW